jgi:hypothetical protein
MVNEYEFFAPVTGTIWGEETRYDMGMARVVHEVVVQTDAAHRWIEVREINCKKEEK